MVSLARSGRSPWASSSCFSRASPVLPPLGGCGEGPAHGRVKST